MTHPVRRATARDADSVIRLLDAAMLSFDRERVRQWVADGDVLVATVREHNRAERRTVADVAADATGDDTGSDDRIVGACVLRDSTGGPTGIDNIAVHHSRRGRGIGTALVDAAATRTDGPLVARFREGVRPFYESLGFAVDAAADAAADSDDDPAATRLRGTLR